MDDNAFGFAKDSQNMDYNLQVRRLSKKKKKRQSYNYKNYKNSKCL